MPEPVHEGSLAVPYDPDPAYRRRSQQLLEFLAPSPADRVLDLGCGLGSFLAILRHQRVESIGLDLDLSRTARAAASAPGARLAVGDALRVPFADETFDGIVMGELLEHLREDGAALREARRLLRPGGVLAISVPHEGYPFWWDPVARVLAWMGAPPLRRGPYVGIWHGHRRLYRPEPLARMVESSGFLVEAVEESTHRCLPFHHFLVYGLGRWLLEKGWLPALWHRSLDRSRSVGASEMTWVLRAVRWAVERVDAARPAETSRVPRPFVHIVLKARRGDVDR
jgi:SAM-dependent methyltransferase